MANKITKKQMFEMIKAEVADNADMVAFIDHEIELLSKKKRSDKPTKKQVENANLAEALYQALEAEGKPLSIPDITGLNSTFEGMSSQKISALLKSLREAKRVKRTYDKKVAVFSIGEEIDEEEEA